MKTQQENQEVAVVTVAEISQKAIEAVKKELNSKYVYSKETLNVLEVGLLTGKNVILFGPGGHSKSTLSEDFFRGLGIEPFVVTMGQGMNPDRLFGGIDIQLLQNEGKIQYLVENSFMNHEFVIFEELLDCPDYILEQLKDILSSKIFRNGGQVFPIKTKFIISNTNRTREDYAKKDSSIKALMERFPLELEVKWKDYNRTTYEQLFLARFGDSDMLLTYILEEFAKKDKVISPRIALEAYEVIQKFGPEALVYIADFASDKTILKQAFTKFKAVAELKEYSAKLDDFLTKFKPQDLENIKDLESLKVKNKEIQQIKEWESKVQALTVDDSLANEKANLTKKYKEVYKEFSTQISKIIAEITK